MYRIAVPKAGLGTRERVKYKERELSKPKEKGDNGRKSKSRCARIRGVHCGMVVYSSRGQE